MSEPTSGPPGEQPIDSDSLAPPKFFESGTLAVLYYDVWFRLAAITVILVGVLLAAVLPKIWTVTPDGFLPVVRISGLDLVQSWSLRRSAEKLEKQGRLADCMVAWRAAGFNDPGSPELARGPIEALVRQPKPAKEFIGIGVDRALWLLRLTRTNAADVSLVTRFFRKYGLDDFAVRFAAPRAAELSDDALRDLMVSLFNMRQTDRFGELWDKHQGQLADNAALRLHRSAWQAVWGPPRTLRSGREEVAAALGSKDPATAELAHQMKLVVSFALNDILGYQVSLAWLAEQHADQVSDHVGHWQLLVRNGRRAEARSLAKAFSRPPATAADAIGMARVFSLLELDEYAAEFLGNHLTEFGYSPPMWVQLAQQYIRLKQWTDLRALALRLRNTPDLRGQLEGYSQFLAGLAELRLQRPEAADKAFSKAVEGQFGDPLTAFNVATEIIRLGYPSYGKRLLQTLESKFGDKAGFWFRLTGAAYEARDMAVLSTAAQKAWELEPKNLAHVNNYAAVLLITRQKPEQAIQLSMQLLAAEPENNDRKVNHILALLQNQRLDEAEKVLKSLNPVALNLNESAIANYSWFELHIRRGEKELARRRYPTVERSQLLQPQLDWMDAEFKKLPPENP